MLNLALLIVLSVLGVAAYGAMYVPYVAGAVAIFYLVSSFVRPKDPSRATIAGLGCAWGWLSISNGVLRSTPASLIIGVIAFVVWLGPHVVSRRK